MDLLKKKNGGVDLGKFTVTTTNISLNQRRQGQVELRECKGMEQLCDVKWFISLKVKSTGSPEN